MQVRDVPLRRLWALVSQLPADAAIWSDRWPTPVEFQAQQLERTDAWGKAMIEALLDQPKVHVPAPIQILRPGDEQPRKRVKATPQRIAEWFARLGGKR